jgi:hypothetical protein
MRRIDRNHRRRLNYLCQPTVEAWNEDTTRPRKLLYLDAATYRVDPIFDIPASDPRSGDYLVSPQGNFAYRNAILPKETPLELFFGKRFGLVFWNGNVVLPKLVDMNRQANTGSPFEANDSEYVRATWGAVWMSITPAEIISQRSAVRKATGKIVIGGLGLGWMLRKVCEKDSVEEVVVVEKSQELLDWYGYDLCRKYPKVKDVICNDIYAEVDRHSDHIFLLDIWPTFRGASKDKRLKTCRRRLKKRLWAWGIN